jgi:hypothetical protein
MNSSAHNDAEEGDPTFDGLDMEKLLNAVDSEDNDYLLHLTTKKIQELNLNILKELSLPKKDTLDMLKQLTTYKYVDEIKELKYGRFLRWVPIKDPTHLKLTKGGVLCDIKATDNGIHIVCKNFMHKHFQFKMDECLIFQRLSPQELVLLSALDHLSK